MEIIQATLEHLEIVASLFDQYRQFYKQKVDIASARNFLKERITKNESVIFLALKDGTGAGFTQLYPSFSSVSLTRLWILNDLFVSPDYRKQDIGMALIKAAAQLGTKTGASGI